MEQTNNAIELIKDRVDILDIISEHVALKRNGKNYWGLCPFHKEKTPSFSVNPEKGIFKCFGCGAAGDAISFLMKYNNQTFMQVMEELAFRYGIEWNISQGATQTGEIKKQMLEANNLTAKFFSQYLLEKKDALEYLEKRGINENIRKDFAIGFAPDKTDMLLTYLTKEKCFSTELLEKAGLISQRSDKKGYIDKFRNRVIIPVLNEKGDAVGFGARIFNSDNGPKYLNSQETLVYNKSKTLYGLYQAKENIRETDSVLIMEGYFDVITAHANGIKNAVASCGTSLTSQHIKVLNKFMTKKHIYLAFDADLAGQKATERNARLVKEEFMPLGEIKQFDTSFAKMSVKDEYACEIRVVTTNSGKDPDEFIRENGAEAYQKCIEKAPLLLDYQLKAVLGHNGTKLTAQEKVAATKELAPILSEINNRIIFEDYLKRISLELGIDRNALEQEIKLVRGANTQIERNISRNVTISSNKLKIYQKNLLSLYFINSEKIPYSWLSEKLKEAVFTEANLIAIKQAIDELAKDSDTVEVLIEKLMSYFAQNVEVKTELADIISSIDDKVELVKSDLVLEFINENIVYINQTTEDNENKKLMDDYHTMNDDDSKAIELQKQLMKKLEYSRME